MNKVSQFSLELAGEQEFYKPGETLEGIVIVEIQEQIKVRGIDLKFKGKGQVHWTERQRNRSTDKRQFTEKSFKEKELYFNATILLFGKPQDAPGENPFHPAGLFKYPFKFTLPLNIPSTFQSGHGSVSYTIHGDLDIPWAIDKSFRREFKVVRDLNLNEIHMAKESLGVTDSRTLCCLCCQNGPISGDLILPHLGYVPGEDIRINAVVDNKSRRKILRTRAIFRQHTHFRANSKAKKVSVDLTDVTDEEDVLGGKHFIWKDVPLTVPHCPASSLQYCTLIDIRYELIFYVDVSGPAIDLMLPMPIIVGTVPLEKVGATTDEKIHNQGKTTTGASIALPPSTPSPFVPSEADANHVKGGDSLTPETRDVSEKPV